MGSHYHREQAGEQALISLSPPDLRARGGRGPTRDLRINDIIETAFAQP